MILVTVGTDMPFDRLVKVVDAWAGETGRSDVFAQIGEGGWVPRHLSFAQFLEPAEFKERFKAARVVISHAGMGTILSALYHEKPILIMPKRATLNEHRNEHQLATARHMKRTVGVNVAFDETELRDHLEYIDSLVPSTRIGTDASNSLILRLSDFIHGVSR